MHEVGRVLYGSNNYQLDGPDSDKDYKVFLCPDFNDLYNSKKVEKNDLPAATYGEQFSPMDVRQFSRNLAKGNVNCCEYLFSTENKHTPDFLSFLSVAREAYEQGYVVTCWDTFFASVEGMVKNSLDRYGVTRKSMSRAYYLYMFVLMLVEDGFRMTKYSWRDNHWNQDVRMMRFDEKSFLPTQEEFYQGFAKLKQWAANRVEDFKKNRPFEYKRLASYYDVFEEEMKKFVKRELQYEQLKGDFDYD